MSRPPDASGPLAVLRVLDFTRLLPGPVATLHLADFDAGAIKILREAGDEKAAIAVLRAAGTI